MTSGVTPTRPLPQFSALSRPYWEGCRRHELVIQRCSSCSSFMFYPRATCPTCGSKHLVWRTVSGDATLFAFTIARRATHRLLSDRVPYVIAVVELDEGPRLTSTVVDAPFDNLATGLRLKVDFEDFGELALPIFRLATK